ncbi:response regulator [Vibrio sp. SM6]|uniref:Response regulator n=1 Tax=Vibrio agarilyticus TaxID=2726741 RepID=A0A7X8YGQ2_9VIBR|nr:response regulator [Vibrio agarilyticus]NLS12656.1 response regulator [Vibrio agarilyticus]
MKILICDDSALARKSILCSIVQTAETELLQAENGREALQLMMEHNIDVLFLDLTMPVMDGFDVLRTLPVSNYHTEVIVVSGDVQRESQQRCLALGAKAFVSKPFRNEEVADLFDALGLQFVGSLERQTPVNHQGATSPISSLAKFRELTNVALGKGAAIISDHMHEFIQLPEPQVGPLTTGELQMTLVDVLNRPNSEAVTQRFVGGGVHGEALVCLRGSDIERVGERLGDCLDFSTHNEVLLNISNMLVSSFLTSLGNQLDLVFSLRQPAIIETLTAPDATLRESEELFTIEYTYFAENLDFECEVLFLLDKTSVDIIYRIVEVL